MFPKTILKIAINELKVVLLLNYFAPDACDFNLFFSFFLIIFADINKSALAAEGISGFADISSVQDKPVMCLMDQVQAGIFRESCFSTL